MLVVELRYFQVQAFFAVLQVKSLLAVWHYQHQMTCRFCTEDPDKDRSFYEAAAQSGRSGYQGTKALLSLKDKSD